MPREYLSLNRPQILNVWLSDRDADVYAQRAVGNRVDFDARGSFALRTAFARDQIFIERGELFAVVARAHSETRSPFNEIHTFLLQISIERRSRSIHGTSIASGGDLGRLSN
jgi:hypothetical protein